MSTLLNRLFGRYTLEDGFSQPQREAVVDLLLLAMYEDSRIGAAESDMIDRQLAAFTWESGTAPQTYVRSATHDVRTALASADGRKRMLTSIVTRLETTDAKAKALALLEHLLGADGISPREAELLARMREMLA